MSTRKILILSLPPEMLWVYAIPSAPIDHGLLQHVPELRVFPAHLARGNMSSSRFPPRSVGGLLPQPPVRHSVMFDTNSLPCLPRILPSASLLRAAFPLLWITPPLRRQKICKLHRPTPRARAVPSVYNFNIIAPTTSKSCNLPPKGGSNFPLRAFLCRKRGGVFDKGA